jgi:hypothetical protein
LVRAVFFQELLRVTPGSRIISHSTCFLKFRANIKRFSKKKKEKLDKGNLSWSTLHKLVKIRKELVLPYFCQTAAVFTCPTPHFPNTFLQKPFEAKGNLRTVHNFLFTVSRCLARLLGHRSTSSNFIYCEASCVDIMYPVSDILSQKATNKII